MVNDIKKILISNVFGLGYVKRWLFSNVKEEKMIKFNANASLLSQHSHGSASE